MKTDTKHLAAAAMTAMLLSSTAMAQTMPDQQQQPAAETAAADDAGEIIVTARRRNETLRDVPLVVNAVTADSIEKLNLKRFEDITAVVPGLAVSNPKNSAGSVTTVRGVAFYSSTSGFNNTVEYYFNDGLVTSSALTAELFDIGQIEVLRGPQGTLRGRASPSGSINITAHRPDLGEVGAYALGTVNDIGGWNVNGAINVPIVADKVGFRLAGVVSEDEFDRVRAFAASQTPLSRTRGIRPSLRLDPFAGVLVVDLTYQNLTRLQRNYGQVESINQFLPGAAASPVTIAARDRLGVTGLAATQRINYNILNWQGQLNLLGQKLTYNGTRLKGYFRSYTPGDQAGIFANDFSPTGEPFAAEVRTDQKNWAHEVRLQNDERIGGLFDYVIGYFNYRPFSTTPIYRQVTALGTLTPTPAITRLVFTPLQVDNRTTENSVFGNLTLHLGSNTELSGGLRKIWHKNDTTFIVNGALLSALNLDTGHTIYAASIKHNFNENLMVYANTGTSWRPESAVPGIGGPTQPSALQRAFMNVKAETSTNYEIGLKSSWLDRRLNVNLSAFRQKFDNFPYKSPSSTFAIDRARNAVVAFAYSASVPVEVKGIEAEVTVLPVRNWTIGAIATYTDGKIKNGAVPCLDLNRDGIPDSVSTAPTFAQLEAVVGANNISSCPANFASGTSPKFAASLQSEYRADLSETVQGYVRGLLSYYGKTANDPANTFDDISAYGLLNLYLGVKGSDDGWEVSLFAKNVLNTFRVTSRTNGPVTTVVALPVGTRSDTNYFGITTTPPREFGVTARISFGSR